jgi:hypothetical protein
MEAISVAYRKMQRKNYRILRWWQIPIVLILVTVKAEKEL